MAATSSQTLFDEARCFSCLGAVGATQTMRIALLSQFLQGIGVSMTAQELIDYGKCFLCLPGVSLADTVELALLDQIVISGGGGTSNLSGTGSPVGVVTPDEENQIYRDTSVDTYWWATGLTSADWQQFV